MKRAIVIDFNHLGVILKTEPRDIYYIQILSPSHLGAMHYYLPKGSFREATEADFEAFKVKSHPDYFREITVDNHKIITKLAS